MKGIKRLASNRYRVRVTRQHPVTGQKRFRVRFVHGPRQLAEQVREELIAELEAEHRGQAPTRLTLTVFAQQWLELRAARLKPSTTAKYTNDLEKHILPVLGNRMLDDLRPSDIKAMFARDQGAPNSRKNRLRLLCAMSKDALADGLIERDFCARVSVKVPKIYTDDEPNLLTAAQLDALLSAIPREQLDLVCVVAFTGLRWGEVSALQWQDLDLVAGILRVRRTNWKGTIQEPKTDAAIRTVALPEPLPEMLRQRRQRMVAKQNRGLSGGWVFPAPSGEPYRGYPLLDVIKEACKTAGIEIRLTAHGLRRTWNDLARRHVSALVVRSIVGHTTEAMTEHYSRVDIGEKRAAAEAVFRAVNPRSVVQMVVPGAATPGTDHGNPQ
jgi:integrase